MSERSTSKRCSNDEIVRLAERFSAGQVTL